MAEPEGAIAPPGAALRRTALLHGGTRCQSAGEQVNNGCRTPKEGGDKAESGSSNRLLGTSLRQDRPKRISVAGSDRFRLLGRFSALGVPCRLRLSDILLTCIKPRDARSVVVSGIENTAVRGTG